MRARAGWIGGAGLRARSCARMRDGRALFIWSLPFLVRRLGVTRWCQPITPLAGATDPSRAHTQPGWLYRWRDSGRLGHAQATLTSRSRHAQARLMSGWVQLYHAGVLLVRTMA